MALRSSGLALLAPLVLLNIGGAVIDPSLVFHERRWRMFAGAPGTAAYAYHADRLEGPWQPHAANPIVAAAPDDARPGGRIVGGEYRLLRFAQDDAATYSGRPARERIAQRFSLPAQVSKIEGVLDRASARQMPR